MNQPGTLALMYFKDSTPGSLGLVRRNAVNELFGINSALGARLKQRYSLGPSGFKLAGFTPRAQK
jgi:hypothetical protein